MAHEWFRPRGYKHFDVAVDERFADISASSPHFTANHSWLPLIHYVKREKRYKPLLGKTTFKDRDIMYASHRDACILSRYAFSLSVILEDFYNTQKLSSNVIAYRNLGKANYAFSAEAFQFALSSAPCVVLCFDVTGFFDNLNHTILKNRIKQVLGVTELSDDWYKVFANVTRFKTVDIKEIVRHPVSGKRFKSATRPLIATIAELKSAGIPILVNKKPFGIPQGTPISSALSNAYMIELDQTMAAVCMKHTALYQRYSDDILLVCQPDDEALLVKALFQEIDRHKLEIKDSKTERVEFRTGSPKAFQYLGFNISPTGALIRANSLARQWRRAKRSIRRIKQAGDVSIASGKSSVIFTKKLRQKFLPVGSRNFSQYARNSAKAFGSKKIVRQILRLERRIALDIENLNK